MSFENDRAYLSARYAVQGLQIGCLVSTPLFFLRVVTGKPFSLRQWLRYSWVVPSLGGITGSSFGYLYPTIQSSPSSTTLLSQSLRSDANRVRRDDLHLIASVLGSLLLPALFLRKVGFVNGILGGAGLGGTVGLGYHQVQKFQKNNTTPALIQQQQQ